MARRETKPAKKPLKQPDPDLVEQVKVEIAEQRQKIATESIPRKPRD